MNTAALISGGRRPIYLLPLVVMVLCAIGMGLAIRTSGIHLQKKEIRPADGRLLSSLPTETLNWQRVGADRVESPEVVEVLGTQNYISRTYVRKDTVDSKRPVFIEFHAAYYTGMIDTVPHVPDRCFVGGGMMLTQGGTRLAMPLDSSRWIPDPDASPELQGRLFMAPIINQYGATAGRVRLPRDPKNIELRLSEFLSDQISGGPRDGKLFAGYFFIANGGATPEAEEVRLLAFNLQDEYAYYCKVQFTSWTVSSMEELNEHSASLLSELLPDLMLCLPDWSDVTSGRHPGTRSGKEEAPGS